MANLNAKIPDQLDEDFEIACVRRKVLKKEGVEMALREFADAAPRPITVTCPVCAAVLSASPKSASVISISPSKRMSIDEDLHQVVTDFINLWRDPTEKNIKKYLADYLAERRAEEGR